MSSSHRHLALLTLVVALAACSSNAKTAVTTTSNTAVSTTAASTATSTNGSVPATEVSTPTTPAPAAGGGSGSATDPCALVTPAEASALAGVTFTTGQKASFPAGSTCLYQTGASGVGVSIYDTPGTPQLAEANKDQVGPDAQPVSGVGDAAYFSKDNGEIGVLANGVLFTIAVVNNGQSASEDVLVAVAEQAIARL